MAGYLTEPEAEAILSSLAPSLRDAWDNASSSDREGALTTASKLLDTEFAFVGYSVSADQEYAWPRKDAYYYDVVRGYEVAVPDNVIPEGVKTATAYLANHILKYGSDIFGYEPEVTSVSLDKISVGLKGGRKPKVPLFIKRLIEPLLSRQSTRKWFMAN